MTHTPHWHREAVRQFVETFNHELEQQGRTERFVAPSGISAIGCRPRVRTLLEVTEAGDEAYATEEHVVTDVQGLMLRGYGRVAVVCIGGETSGKVYAYWAGRCVLELDWSGGA